VNNYIFNCIYCIVKFDLQLSPLLFMKRQEQASCAGREKAAHSTFRALQLGAEEHLARHIAALDGRGGGGEMTEQHLTRHVAAQIIRDRGGRVFQGILIKIHAVVLLVAKVVAESSS
jgi:hypothetical protein